MAPRQQQDGQALPSFLSAVHAHRPGVVDQLHGHEGVSDRCISDEPVPVPGLKGCPRRVQRWGC